MTKPMSMKLYMASRVSHRKYLHGPRFNFSVVNNLRDAYPAAMACTYPTRSSHPNAGSCVCSGLSVKIHQRESGTIITVCTCDTTCIDLPDDISTVSMTKKSDFKEACDLSMGCGALGKRNERSYIPIISSCSAFGSKSRRKPASTENRCDNQVHDCEG